MSGQLEFYSCLGQHVFCIMVGLCSGMPNGGPCAFSTYTPSRSLPTLLDQRRDSANV